MIIDTTTLTDLADADLYTATQKLGAEMQRRHTMASAETIIGQANRDWLGAAGREPGQPWIQPTGYHDAYPHGWEVTHGGKTWTSTRNGASGVPGESPDWREVATEGQVLDWSQPHAGSEYPVGAIVRHNGRIWRNDHVTVNGWEPGTTGSQWTDLGPA